MKIALHDSDKTRFPNLALMKISARHKNAGHKVVWFDLKKQEEYDRVYSSKVFTFTQEDSSLPDTTIKGGTGYDMSRRLRHTLEHTCPDYGLYNLNYSVGFLTRGCPRSCTWCVVPEKEGKIQAHADIEEFARHKEVVLLDNNVLASDHGLQQIKKIAAMKLKIDFNQGLDARLIDGSVAKLLSKIKWRVPLRLACDHKGQMKSIQRAVELLRWHNVTPTRYFVYCLVQDIDDAVERIKFLKGLNLDPFAQPFISRDGALASKEQRALARWVNHKAEFKSRTWEEYRTDKLPKRR